MATRTTVLPKSQSNYDSKGLSTGQALGDIFADLEVQYIVNRKKVFENAKKSPNGFMMGSIQQLQAYNQANAEAASKALKEAIAIAKNELEKSYAAGVSVVDKTVDYYKKQGYEPPQVPNETEAPSESLIRGLAVMLSTFAGLASYSRTSADRQLLSVVSMVNPASENIDKSIDDAQMLYLQRGIAGAQITGGIERGMSVQAEFIMRDQSHQVLLGASGERQQEYGLPPLVRVSAHPSSCEKCVPWQDQVLVDDVFQGGFPDGKHELLSTAFDAGLGHINCRHTWVGYIEGLDRPDIFTNSKLSDKETAARYAVEKRQRDNERTIREWKRRAEGSMDDNNRLLAEQKVREWQARQRDLANIARRNNIPFYRQYSREQIGGETRPTLNRVLLRQAS